MIAVAINGGALGSALGGVSGEIIGAVVPIVLVTTLSIAYYINRREYYKRQRN